MRTYEFVALDVFTDRVFGGNQLAVFLEPEGLTDSEMQAIARELNLAETTFVFPAGRSDAVARVRIFTPATELAFAGHPTVGTAWVLANSGRLPPDRLEHALEEGIGLVPIRLEGDARAPTSVWMSQRDAEFGPPMTNRTAIAQALSLSEADLLEDHPIRTGSTGMPFLLIPLKTPQAVDRVKPDMGAVQAASTGERTAIFVFAPDPERGRANVYSRMFAGDTFGVTEDAATGSASGPLGAYVAEQRVVELGSPIQLISLQGNKMGRPSFIQIRLELRDGKATSIQIGGGVVPVLKGQLTLPS